MANITMERQAMDTVDKEAQRIGEIIVGKYNKLMDNMEDNRNEAINNIKELPVKLIVLGDGRYKETALSLIKEKRLKSHFIFLGSFSPTEMPKFFSHADALLVSLKKEKIFSQHKKL